MEGQFPYSNDDQESPAGPLVLSVVADPDPALTDVVRVSSIVVSPF